MVRSFFDGSEPVLGTDLDASLEYKVLTGEQYREEYFIKKAGLALFGVYIHVS